MTDQTAQTPDNSPATAGSLAASVQSESTTVDDTATSEGQASEGQATDAGATPEVPEAYRGEDGQADLNKLLARVAEADAAPEGVPASPGEYDLALPEDLEMPEGFDLKIDPENEHLKAALATFHEAGVSQEVVSKILPAYVQALAGDMQAANMAQEEAVQAEIQKLGDNPAARVEGLKSSLTQTLGAEDSAIALLDNISSVAAFEAVENLISKINGGDESVRVAKGGAKEDTRSFAERMFPNEAKRA